MAHLVRKQSHLELELDVSIAFDHFPGVKNVIPDMLSRGAIGDALAEMEREGIPNLKRVHLGAEWECWMDALELVIKGMNEKEEE